MEMKTKISILGQEYEFKMTDLNETPKHDGVCRIYSKEIEVLSPEYLCGESDRFVEVLYHELIHAYCKESGASFDENEDLVNWIAFMIPKIVESANEILEKLDAQSKD